MLSNFAIMAKKNNYSCPKMTTDTFLDVQGARHPVIEKQLPLGTPYIANDLYLDREKQLRIAKETLEIYAPIAHRIGMNNLYRELEDLAFKTIYPTRYERLIAAVKKNRGGQKRLLNKIDPSSPDK